MNRIIIGLSAVLFAGASLATGNNNGNNNGPQGGDSSATATATATGGSAKVENHNDVRNSNVNSNVNSNRNEQSQGQGQAQGQKQGQVQGQGQGQSQSTKNSNNAKQSTDVSFSSPRNPASAMPGAANTTASCRHGLSAGVGGFLPIGIGGTLRDVPCDKRESARLRMEMAKIAVSVGDNEGYARLMSEAYELLNAADAEVAGGTAAFEPTPSESYVQ
jgi:hypothetical protein